MPSPVLVVAKVLQDQSKALSRINVNAAQPINAIVADAFAAALRDEHRVRAFLDGLVDESAFCPPRDINMPVVESVGA